MDSKIVLDFCKQNNKGEEETDSIMIAFASTKCNPDAGIECPRFVAIREHVDTFCRDYVLEMTSNLLVKEEYDQEFWRHAPSNLLDSKKLLELVPWNHFQMDRFSTLIKLYKYQLEYPNTTYSIDPEERKLQKRNVCKHMSAHSWENWDTE